MTDKLVADKAKRHSLKVFGALGAGAVALTTSAGVLARHLFPAGEMATARATGGAEIRVHTRVSAQTNDLEVVVTNVSWAPAKVFEFAPGNINTRRGSFDLDELLVDGPMEIAAGKSVVVPMKHHTVVLDGTGIEDRLASLADSVSSMRVVTKGAAFA